MSSIPLGAVARRDGTVPGFRWVCAGLRSLRVVALLGLVLFAAQRPGAAQGPEQGPEQGLSSPPAPAQDAGITGPEVPAPTEEELAAASRGVTIRVGTLGSGQPGRTLPLEVYVARVLAGEGEPRAAGAARQALAVAIRTYALANAGRHEDEGFDLCDSTHCQVPRASTPATRAAVMATLGQVLVHEGRPAQLYYSASCGGHTQVAGDVWPGVDFPYLQPQIDAVHEDDAPWTLDLPLADVQRALAKVGYAGRRLSDVRVVQRSTSDRVTRLSLRGLRPEQVGGEQFRMAIGPTIIRSTLFTMERRGNRVHFTGRGYGHGVGMCVVGAGRRAARGDSVAAILAFYYPGLELRQAGEVAPHGPLLGETPLSAGAPAEGLVRPPVGVSADTAAPPVTGWPTAQPAVPSAGAPTPAPRGSPAVQAPGARLLDVRAADGSGIESSALAGIVGPAYDELSRRLGVSVSPVAVVMHDTVEAFRRASGRPWWASAHVSGTTIHLQPATLLVQREGVDVPVRVAIAEMLTASALADRPAWVRIGVARYVAHGEADTQPAAATTCPSDADLLSAESAPAQREADARAEACVARAMGRGLAWRDVR
ncbi:MAG: SpoIID/LytB domain-containing protein [Vicinamibacterales bacterium]